MLTICKECGLQVSDQAPFCPHCGYPQKNSAKSRKYPQRARSRLKLPNGFGQITKLNTPGLRKQYRAMVTVGKNENGRPICKLLKPVSYFRTYNEAYAALIEFNKNKGLNLPVSDMTLGRLYEEWYNDIEEDGRSKSYLKLTNTVWNYCKPLGNRRLIDLKPKELRDFIINTNTSSSFKLRIKSVLSTMYDYAVSLEYIDHNTISMFKLPSTIVKDGNQVAIAHNTFTNEEIQTLWDASTENIYAKMILIQCYSGWRPGELIAIRLEDVDLINWTFTGGSKTDSGKDRTVPIHSKIQEFVKSFYERATEHGCPYLLTTDVTFVQLKYSWYYNMFLSTIEKLGLSKHKPHDPRKFFITEAKRKGVNDYAIKRIVGHKITDLTENIYTERDVEWLREEIEKM